jgi:transposase
VTPDNNHAERVLRQGVLWRKMSFGSDSETGSRYVERILTAIETLKLQHRPQLQWLIDTLRAPIDGQPLPTLLPAN